MNRRRAIMVQVDGTILVADGEANRRYDLDAAIRAGATTVAEIPVGRTSVLLIIDEVPGPDPDGGDDDAASRGSSE